MIALIDYNMGNLRSVTNAFEKIGSSIEVVRDPEKIKDFDKLILPGVGAFKDAMEHLNTSGMNEAILEFSKTGKPLLGICLGMQLLLESSEEFGFCKGLGLIPGIVKEFDATKFGEKLKVPHVGWNKLFKRENSPILENLDDEIYLYFVHSFHASVEAKYTLGETFYGYDFASAVHKDNIYGFQPHPEKSHEKGLKILENFTRI